MKNAIHIVAAMNPRRYEDDYTIIYLRAWFEEHDNSFEFAASLFDCEPHGRELWFRAMKGEYGEIEILPCSKRFDNVKLISKNTQHEPIRMLTYDNRQH